MKISSYDVGSFSFKEIKWERVFETAQSRYNALGVSLSISLRMFALSLGHTIELNHQSNKVIQDDNFWKKSLRLIVAIQLRIRHAHQSERSIPSI